MKEDVYASTNLIDLRRLPDTVWEDVPPPKNHRDPPPSHQVTFFPQTESWDGCTIPFTGLVVRDQYPTGEVADQAYVESPHLSRCGEASTRNSAAAAPGVTRALVHFALVDNLWPSLFRWQCLADGPLASLPRALIPEVDWPSMLVTPSPC
jgi:hypothetical protein